MPFTSTTVFDPDTLEILQQAHSEACLWLTGKDGIGPDVGMERAVLEPTLSRTEWTTNPEMRAAPGKLSRRA
jgi:hypothetical protein